MKLDLVGKLRSKQKTMICDEETHEKFQSLMHEIYAQETGQICPPFPEMLNPIDRVNFVLFWSMARLIEEMANEMSMQNSDFALPSEDSIIDSLDLAATSQNARDNPIFLLLQECLANKPKNT